jgi:hypothetical protein
MINNIKYAFLPVVMFTMATFTSCEEDIEIGNKIDESSLVSLKKCKTSQYGSL